MKVAVRPIAFIADVHLGSFRDFGGAFGEDGLNERAHLTLRTLRRAVEAAQQAGCQTLYICGDMFHKNNPPGSLIGATQRALELIGMALIVPGNHDLVGVHAEAGNTAVESLRPVAGVYRRPAFSGIFHDDPRDGEAFPIEPATFNIPFDARRPMREVIKEACKQEELRNPGTLRNHVLVTHVGVVDDGSPPWLRDGNDAMHVDDLMGTLAAYDMPLAVVGNYHRHQIWHKAGRYVCQVGALNPTGFGDEGLEGYGGLAIWDGKELRWQSIPGPRFVKVPNAGPIPIPDENSIFVRIEKGPAKWSVDGFAGWEEVEPGPPVVAADAEVVEVPRLIEGAEDALREYVAKMSLPDGVSRATVLDEVMRYWRTA